MPTLIVMHGRIGIPWDFSVLGVHVTKISEGVMDLTLQKVPGVFLLSLPSRLTQGTALRYIGILA